MDKNLVFIYGTLKRGQVLHRFIEGSKFISTARLKRYNMFKKGSIPFIMKGRNIIIGEVFEVNDETLNGLDILEGGYTRVVEEIELDNGEQIKAFVYIIEK